MINLNAVLYKNPRESRDADYMVKCVELDTLALGSSKEEAINDLKGLVETLLVGSDRNEKRAMGTSYMTPQFDKTGQAAFAFIIDSAYFGNIIDPIQTVESLDGRLSIDVYDLTETDFDPSPHSSPELVDSDAS